jgi:UDP:flavonoid glycosyltransferase YjiC (YdhE family)
MKVLFTAIPTHSHIAPMLPLVDGAVRAGHDVTFVTGAEGIPLVERAGVRAIELGHTWAETTKWYGELLAATKPALQTPDDALLHYIVTVFVGHLTHGMAPGLIPLVAEIEPNLVISDTSELAGRIAALRAGVPHVVHGFGPQQSGEIVAPVGAAIAEVAAKYGVSEKVIRGWNDELYLDIWPAVVDDRSEKMFGNVLPLRPAVVSKALPADEVLHGLPFDRTVYVTLGTMFNSTESGARALEKLIAVFTDEQINAIVTVGRDGDVARFDSGHSM